MTLTATSTLPAPAAAECDARLRQARQLLDAGQLAPASAAGWQAAQSAMAAYAANDGATAGAGFTDAARQLVKHCQDEHCRDDGRVAEWAVSALALSDNAQYDWLDRDGVARRLDDVQRLAILVQDIANRPPTAADLLRQAWQCMDNGYLIAAADIGWDAALLIAHSYAHAIGRDFNGERDFDTVLRWLDAEQSNDGEVRGWAYAAATLRQTAAYCAKHSDRSYAELFAEDLDAVGKLADFVQAKVAAGKRLAV